MGIRKDSNPYALRLFENLFSKDFFSFLNPTDLELPYMPNDVAHECEHEAVIQAILKIIKRDELDTLIMEGKATCSAHELLIKQLDRMESNQKEYFDNLNKEFKLIREEFMKIEVKDIEYHAISDTENRIKNEVNIQKKQNWIFWKDKIIALIVGILLVIIGALTRI